MHFGFINATFLDSDQWHVSGTQAAIFRAVSARIQIYLVCRLQTTVTIIQCWLNFRNVNPNMYHFNINIFVFLHLPPWSRPHWVAGARRWWLYRFNKATFIKPKCIYWPFVITFMQLINAWNMEHTKFFRCSSLTRTTCLVHCAGYRLPDCGTAIQISARWRDFSLIQSI